MKYTLIIVSLLLLSPYCAPRPIEQVKYLFVLYLENWSFDGLFGKFEGADGIDNAIKENRYIQKSKSGEPYEFLPQDQNKFMPDDLPNMPFDLVPLMEKKEMPPSNLVHRYFHEIHQINNGSMDMFTAYSNAKGLSMSYIDISNQYFGKLAKSYTLLDNFYHSAFGGSFLNHQWLISARTPTYPKEILDNNSTLRESLVSTFDEDGFVDKDLPLYFYEGEYYAVNHIESENLPHSPYTTPEDRIPSFTHRNIGDILSDAGISWRWYAGGYDDAERGNATQYQYHHQPFVFFERFKDPKSQDRKTHLRDEKDLLRDLKIGNIPKVTFYKPYGEDNFHPNSSDLDLGQKKLEEIVTAIQDSPYYKDSAIVITFDENGGRWDHKAPPKGDMWGPATRIPAIIVSPFVKKGHVDSTQFETLSIMRFIENMVGLNETLIPEGRNVQCLCKVLIERKESLNKWIIIGPGIGLLFIVAIVVTVLIVKKTTRKDTGSINSTYDYSIIDHEEA